MIIISMSVEKSHPLAALVLDKLTRHIPFAWCFEQQSQTKQRDDGK